MTQPGIDPDDLATTLRVLKQLPELHPDHPDITTVKRAASYMYKLVKKSRRAEIRQELEIPQIPRKHRRGGHPLEQRLGQAVANRRMQRLALTNLPPPTCHPRRSFE